MNKTVVQIVKSGNRFNAWDADGNKYTSQISNGTRKISIQEWLLNRE